MDRTFIPEVWIDFDLHLEDILAFKKANEKGSETIQDIEGTNLVGFRRIEETF